MSSIDVNYNPLTETQNNVTSQTYSTFSSLFRTSNDDPKFVDLLNIYSYPGYSLMDNVKITGKLKELENAFDQTTEKTRLTSSFNNVSQYVMENQDTVHKDLRSQSNSSLNNLYKSRQSFEVTKNNIDLQQFGSANLKAALFFAIFICGTFMLLRLPNPIYQMKMAIIISSCIFAVYLIVVIVLYMGWLQKRNDDWSKLYFKPPKQATL